MTLLEPEMLMMAVQSGNSLFPANSVYHRFLKKKVGHICTRIGWKWGGM